MKGIRCGYYNSKNKQKKKQGNFVFLIIAVSITILIFSLTHDSFAQELPKECYDINYTGIENIDNYWSREVKDDQKVEAILPQDPCKFRSFNSLMEKKYRNYSDSTHDWYTGIVLHRIGEIDTVAGTYDMKFQYYVEVFDKNDTSTNFEKKEPKIDFINMVGVPQVLEKTKGFNQTDHYYDITVSGKFFTDIDFKEFPFEKIKLNIIAEPFYDKNDTSSIFGYADSQKDSIQFHIWPYYGLLKPDVPSPGYKIKSYDFTTYDYLRDKGAEYSRYDATYIIERPFLDSFLKYIFPVLVLSILAFVTIVFPSEMYMTKISLNAFFLLGILFFVRTVQEKIPNIGEMTIFDYVVIMSYGIIVVAILNPTLKWKKRKKYELEKEERDNWKDTDRRNHDLNMENLGRTESDIEFFKGKLERCSESDRNKISEVIEHLYERRSCLDKLKNIDSKISLLAKKRYIFSMNQLRHEENLGPAEIREKIINHMEKKYHYLSKKETHDFNEIKKSVDVYFDLWNNMYGDENHKKEPLKFDPRLAKLEIKRRYLTKAWKKYGKLITMEERLDEKGVSGTIQKLDELEVKRADVVKELQRLEGITEDNNEEMVINDDRFLDAETREIISKNEMDELNAIDHANTKYNRLAFMLIGGIFVIGLSYIFYILR